MGRRNLKEASIMNLTFIWTVTTNVLSDGTYIYQVYRNRFANEPDHSGNREFRGGIFSSKEEAQKFADELNAN